MTSFHLPLKKSSTSRRIVVVAILLVAAIGIYSVIGSHAASPYVSAEAENGTLAGGAALITDTNASGGSAVKFNGSSSCPSGQAQANDETCVAIPSSQTKLVFDDEFNNGSTIDTSLWNVVNAHGDTSNAEPECYTPAGTAQSGGFLNETVSHQTVTCPGDASNGNKGTMSSNYSSGAVQSKTFNYEYGTIQARIKFAGGSGPWPAFWLLGHNCQLPNWLTTLTCNWPNPGSTEVDVAEILSSNHQYVNEQIHAQSGSPNCDPGVSDVSQNWHVYGLTWTSGKLVYTIDGAVTCTFTSAVPAENMFIIINLAVGAGGGGTINNANLPQTTSVDYVRVFQ